jgi:hypothetical protein
MVMTEAGLLAVAAPPELSPAVPLCVDTFDCRVPALFSGDSSDG